MVESNKNQLRLPSTSDRIRKSALQLFAEYGFQKTRIRDIAINAGCNVSSVNYYFHGKDKLYKEIFEWQSEKLLCSLESSHFDTNSNSYYSLEYELSVVIKQLVFYSLNATELSPFMFIVCHEITAPHLPRTFFEEKFVFPVKKYFFSFFQEKLPDLKNESVDLCVFSFWGQLLHLINVYRLFFQFPENMPKTFRLKKAITHITEFTAAGAMHLSIKDKYQWIIDDAEKS